ncbi:C-type lectin domain family 4 member E isoform X2 [Biomphalaria glabrata]|nr:C-type lectin domain family 4 member E isoform X2 [Biomphalaria glabrata]
MFGASLILIHAFVFKTIEAGTLSQSLFQLSYNAVGSTALGAPWQDRSRVSCIVTCMETYANCNSVRFNPTTGVCTPGSTTSYTAPPASADDGELYLKLENPSTDATCDSGKNISLQKYGSESSCIGLYKTHVPFTDYTQNCAAIGLKTVQVSTADKLKILQNISNGTDFWIGCYSSGDASYFWFDSGQSLTSLEANTIFPAGEMNKTFAGGNCCQYCPHNNTASIVDCSRKAPYSCEM